jgi:threonine dehydratase
VIAADAISAAHERIRPYVRRTPVVELRAGELPGLTVDVVLKLELLQHTGSFKPRGAFNRVLTSTVPAAGLIAASGGNHGAALAYVAATLAHPAEIFVPATSPAMKAERIRSLGATVIVGGDRYDDAQAAADERATATGALAIHPYDHPDTVAGAGTCAKELHEDAGPFDVVVSATGGGGLTAGTAAWFAGSPTQVVSVEPATSRALHAALAAGAPVEVVVEGVAIDSLGAKRIGDVPFAVCRDAGVQPVTVTDDAIVHAQQMIWRHLRLVAEPGGATALAALLSGALSPAQGARVGVIACGANCDPATVL